MAAGKRGEERAKEWEGGGEGGEKRNPSCSKPRSCTQSCQRWVPGMSHTLIEGTQCSIDCLQFNGGPSSAPINWPPVVGYQGEGVDVSSPLWNKIEWKILEQKYRGTKEIASLNLEGWNLSSEPRWAVAGGHCLPSLLDDSEPT